MLIQFTNALVVLAVGTVKPLRVLMWPIDVVSQENVAWEVRGFVVGIAAGSYAADWTNNT